MQKCGECECEGGMRKRDVLGKFSFRAPSSRFGLIALLPLLDRLLRLFGFRPFSNYRAHSFFLSFSLPLEVPILVIFYVVVLR